MTVGERALASPFRVFVGWDSHLDEVYQVCKFSIERRSSIPVEVQPLKLQELRVRGLYWRPADPLASTEFTYSRFLTPAVANFTGWALFCDCDFLWLADIADLIRLRDGSKAVLCVRHVHAPAETHKMDGKIQTLYPRKNWSSLMLLNCDHPSVRGLTPEVVNTQTGSYLHRMAWAADEAIGALPGEWNWLEGWDEAADGYVPKAIHFTRGGPWYKECASVAFAALWQAERLAMQSALSLERRISLIR